MSILKANVSKSIALRQRLKLWLEENKSFENVYQALSHDDELSLKLFHEEVLIAHGFVTGCRRRYFERHCFFIDDAEVIDVTFDTSHKLAVREYTVVECYTLSDYLRLIEYNPQKPLLEMNLTLN